jgi:beta-glucosidase
VKNIGSRAGTETVQVYVGHLPAAIETEPKKLAGFARVTLAPGEQRDLTVRVDRRSLSHWDATANRWVSRRGEVPVYVGSSSRDLRLTGHIRVL